MKYILYATNKDGDGFVHEVGQYEDLDDINIRVGFFADDVVLTIEQKFDEEDKADD